MATNLVNPAGPQLVLQNYFSLVQAIASKIKRRLPAHVDVEDLVQTGMIGLLEASSRYDASRMVDFSSYANSRITGAILDELRKWDTCSRQDRKAGREFEDVKSRLRAESGTEPDRQQIAEAVGLGLAAYERTLQRLESSKQPATHPDKMDSDFNDELAQIPSPDASPFELFCKREDFKVLKSYIAKLKSKQRQVLELYYFQDLGLKEIGTRLGVGEARISQIHKQAILELRRLISGAPTTQPAMVSALVQ
jgi:RNA polymerase sigma factor for flagellar operon FliA